MEQPTQKAIAKLQEGDFNVYIIARVIRKWRKEDWNHHGKGRFHKVELLLVDEEQNVVQCLITKSLIKTYDAKLQEGKTYKIERFQTIRNNGFNTATTHKCRIRFGTTTTIDEVDDDSIPKHGFKSVDFEDIIGDKLQGRNLIDVIARVDDYKPVFVQNKTKRMALDLADKNDTQLSFWLWGPYTKDGEKISTEFRYKMEKPIIVLQCVERVVTKGGHVRISTVDDATKIYINPDMPEIHDIRARLLARPGRSIGVVESKKKTILDDNCKTLHQIMSTELAGKYVTVAYLTEIDDGYRWYRNICQKCTSMVVRKHGEWYCTDDTCIASHEGSHDRATRFKVRFLVNDDSGAKAKILMYDAQIKKKVAKTPLECLDILKQQGDVDGVPQELTSMLQKKYVLKLIVHKRYNLELSSRCYTVVDYNDDLEDLNAWTQQHKMVEEMNAASSEMPDSMAGLLEKIQAENDILAASIAEDDSAMEEKHDNETVKLTQESAITSETQTDSWMDEENESGSNSESLTPSSKRTLSATDTDGDAHEKSSAKKGKAATISD